MKNHFYTIAFVMLVLCGSTQLAAQKFHSKLGFNGLISLEEESQIFPVLVYGARYNIHEPNEESSISINADLGLNFEFYGGSSGSGVRFDFDVPVYAAYNFRGYSTMDFDSYLGGYVGAGLEYINFATSFTSPNSSVAPMVTGGIRFAVGAGDYGVSCSYRLGNSEQHALLGLKFFWLLGDY